MSTTNPTQRFAAAVEHTNSPSTSRVVACLGALVAYLPIGLALIDAYPAFAIVGVAITIGIADLPDKLTWRFIPHGWTHSLIGGAAIGGALAGAGWWVATNIVIHAGGAVVTPNAAASYCFAIGTLAAYGHVLGDFLTGTDVRPLWPFANYEFSINLPRLLDPRDNEGINLVGTMALVCVVVALVSSGVTAATLP